jgi:Protein of unknown function (DUF1488)
MTSQPWSFPEEPWFDQDFAAVKFAAVRGTERVVCAISQIAINDQFHTQDSPEDAMHNYRAHSDWVRAIAIRLIELGQPHPNGFYLITSKVVKELGS